MPTVPVPLADDDPDLRSLQNARGLVANGEDYDNAVFGRIAVEALARRGARNIVMIAPPLEQTYAHHMIEAVFKGAGRALRRARERSGHQLPSTKGVL